MPEFDRLTLEEKVGQLFFLGFQGSTIDHDAEDLFDEIRPGGVIFSKRNIETFDGVHEQTRRVREQLGIRTLVGIDHEGGAADPLKRLFGAVPPVPNGRFNLTRVRAIARVIAAELQATGFNIDFAPSIDRSIPNTRDAVRDTVRAAQGFAEELRAKGILACFKHFPGQSAAIGDPHFVLPTVNRSRREVIEQDALPFALCLSDAAMAASMMMVGHSHYSAFDERRTPASLSPRVVDGILRRRMGYKGVSITADLSIGAIARSGLSAQTFLAAFLAGNDMMLFSKATPMVAEAFRLILRSAKSSPSLRARVEESAERIRTLKSSLPTLLLPQRPSTRLRIVRSVARLHAQEPVASSVVEVPDIRMAQ